MLYIQLLTLVEVEVVTDFIISTQVGLLIEFSELIPVDLLVSDKKKFSYKKK